MNRSEILTELKKLDDIGLNRDLHSVTYGAAMVLWWIKEETDEIDIAATVDGMKALHKRGFELQPYNGDIRNLYYKVTNNINVFSRYTLKNGMGWVSQRVEGYKVMEKRKMISEYMSRGREKDIKHAQMIWDWMYPRGYKDNRWRPGGPEGGPTDLLRSLR